jgi:hypothetical protein
MFGPHHGHADSTHAHVRHAASLVTECANRVHSRVFQHPQAFSPTTFQALCKPGSLVKSRFFANNSTRLMFRGVRVRSTALEPGRINYSISHEPTPKASAIPPQTLTQSGGTGVVVLLFALYRGSGRPPTSAHFSAMPSRIDGSLRHRGDDQTSLRKGVSREQGTERQSAVGGSGVAARALADRGSCDYRHRLGAGIQGHEPGEQVWASRFGNIISEWTQILGLVLMTKRLMEVGSKAPVLTPAGRLSA